MEHIEGQSRNWRLRAFFTSKKGKQLVWLTVFVVVLGVAALTAYFRYAAPDHSNIQPSQQTTDTSINPIEIVPPPVKYYSNLDGTETAQNLVNRRPLAIMVENHPDARPQAGLNKASQVWEAIVEGGITRFMAVFSAHDAQKVGPVRSARPYFIHWASGYQALYAHAGGSEAGLKLLSTTNDVTDLPHTSKYFHREPKPGLAIEHTLFTSTNNLYTYAQKKGASLDSSVGPFSFADELTPDRRSTDASITIDFSSASYKVRWKYDHDRNAYLRFLAGAPHNDRVTGDQLNARSVVVLTVNRRYDANTNHGKGEWFMTTEGDGKMLVFQNGTVTEGMWHKATAGSMLELKDASGSEIKLLRGQTWFEVVPPKVPVRHSETLPANASSTQSE